MIRAAGSILVLAACIMWGLCKGTEMSIHVRELEEIKHIFLFVRGELQYTRSTFADVFIATAQKTEGIYRRWLQTMTEDLKTRQQGSFDDIWKRNLNVLFSDTHLTKEEQVNLLQVGKSLNYSDTIDLYLLRLDEAIQLRKEEEKSKKKLYQSLGILGGIFFVIVLL